MATVEKKDKVFNKNSYRGLTLEQLEKLSTEDMVDLFRARIRRRFSRSSSPIMQKSSTNTTGSS